jgi:hypothetical protein
LKPYSQVYVGNLLVVGVACKPIYATIQEHDEEDSNAFREEAMLGGRGKPLLILCKTKVLHEILQSPQLGGVDRINIQSQQLGSDFPSILDKAKKHHLVFATKARVIIENTSFHAR